MNETLYIYYIIPATNFVSQKETTESSNNLQSGFEKISGLILAYFPLLLLLIAVYYLVKKV
jgi:hypothetical protein